MRLSLFTVAALTAVCLTQTACAREPSKAPERAEPMAAAQPVAASVAVDVVAPVAACNRSPAATIDAAVMATLNAVSSNNPRSLLSQMSHDGVDINGTVSWAGLSKQFSARTGRYCDLFTCAGRPGAMHHLFHSGKIDKQVDVKNGRASVTINANTNDELDLSYRWNACQWELTAMAGT